MDVPHHAVFNVIVRFLDWLCVLASLAGNDNLTVIFQRDSGVWNENIQQNGVRFSTMLTLYALYDQGDEIAQKPDCSTIVAIFSHASAMAACACDLMKLHSGHDSVIIFLRKGIEVFRPNCYHSVAVVMGNP